MTTPQRRCGVLLAGGASTRFGGTPKGLAPLGGMRVADFVLRALDAVCTETIVAANDPAAGAWFPQHRIVTDSVPGRGALGALETALTAATARTVVVCAWDMPFVSAAVLEALAAAVDAGASCCIPTYADGTSEPLCAAYDAAAAPTATTLLANGARAAHELVAVLGGSRWMIDDESQGRDAQRIFLNINTREDLAQAVAWHASVRSPS
jgi:molybdopterin-guanine dinucleotide biosynthesis protein A